MTAPVRGNAGRAKLVLLAGLGAGGFVFVWSIAASARQPDGSILSGIFAGLIGGLIVAVIAAWLAMRIANPPQPVVIDQALGSELETTVAAQLAELEAARQATVREINRRAVWRVALGAAGGAALVLNSSSAEAGDIITQPLFCGGLGYVWAASALSARYRRLYKDMVLPRLAARFGAMSYRAAHIPDLARLRDAGLFGDFDSVIAEDELFGTHKGLPTSIIELRLEAGSGDSTTLTFGGLLVEITLPRSLSGSTAVVASAGLLASIKDWLGNAGRQRVKLEDPKFEAIYQAWSTDQIAARALLTPAFMERLLALGARNMFGRPMLIADDNRLLLAIPRMGRLFEPPSYLKPAASRAALVAMNDDIAAVLGVADEVIALDYFAAGVAAGGQGTSLLHS